MNFKKFFESVPLGRTKLSIFDFDDTLVFTPRPEEGIPKYEKKTGKLWDKKIWWNQKESLTEPVFSLKDDNLNKKIAKLLWKAREDSETYVVIMTGRLTWLEKEVKKILAHYNLYADEYFFRHQKDLIDSVGYPKRDTFDYKAFVILDRLMAPHIKEVVIYDDREEHIPKFVELAEFIKGTWPEIERCVVQDVRKDITFDI